MDVNHQSNHHGYLENCRGIWVIGCPCSGKTTLAHELSHKLNVQVTELDAFVWASNWQRTHEQEVRQNVSTVMENSAWIIDGDYPETRNILKQKADCLIWLDIPLWILVSRLVLRTLKNITCNKKLWNGNQESLLRFLSRDSMLKFLVNTYKQKQITYQTLFHELSHPGCATHLIRLTSNKTVKEFINNLNKYRGA